MTGEELEALRVRIGAPSQGAMADLLQCDPVGYRRYATGARPIPRYIERSARLLEFVHLACHAVQPSCLAQLLNKRKDMQTQNAAVAAIQFALETDDGMAFLRCWNEGNFEAIRREWPEAPEAVFVGADPLHPATPV